MSSIELTIPTHFTTKELNCPCNCGLETDRSFLLQLENLRRVLDIPLLINSGARCADYNKDVGGVDGSYHVVSRAVDIKCLSSDLRFHLIKTALNLGFSGIGIHKRFIHLDDRNRTGEPEKCWLY